MSADDEVSFIDEDSDTDWVRGDGDGMGGVPKIAESFLPNTIGMAEPDAAIRSVVGVVEKEEDIGRRERVVTGVRSNVFWGWWKTLVNTLAVMRMDCL